MPQIHYQQHGIFHVTTNTADRIPWCTENGVPQRIIDCLRMTRDIHDGRLHAFCILPDHVHAIMCPGPKGISSFMQTFKSNSTKNLRNVYAGKFGWQSGFYDERIRDERQRSAALGYVLGNAMKHRLIQESTDWPWTSLHFPDVCDPLDMW